MYSVRPWESSFLWQRKSPSLIRCTLQYQLYINSKTQPPFSREDVTKRLLYLSLHLEPNWEGHQTLIQTVQSLDIILLFFNDVHQTTPLRVQTVQRLNSITSSRWRNEPCRRHSSLMEANVKFVIKFSWRGRQIRNTVRTSCYTACSDSNWSCSSGTASVSASGGAGNLG